MKIKSLFLYNFISYAKQEIVGLEDFSVTGIIGNYKNNLNKSNGVGKSTIIDAILYALYGRGRTAGEEDLIMLGKDNMLVTLTFELNNEEIEITRKKEKGTSLYLQINGKDFSEGVRETQAKINNLIGMDYNLFIATVFFQQTENDSFTSATPTVRKEYLKNILNLDFYDKCLAKTKEKIKLITPELQDLRSKLDYIEEKDSEIDIEQINAIISETEKKLNKEKKAKEESEKANNDREFIEEELAENEESIDILNTSIEDLETNDKENKDKLNTYKKELKASEKDFNWDYKVNQKSIIAVNEDSKQKLEDKKTELLRKDVTLGIKIADTKKKGILLKENNSCPSCGREIDEKFKEKTLTTLRKEFTDYKKERESIKKEIEKTFDAIIIYNDCIRAANNTIDECDETKDRINNLKQKINNLEKTDTQKELKSLRNDLNKEEEKKKKLELKLKELPKPKKYDISLIEECEESIAEKKALKKQAELYKKEKKELKKKIKVVLEEYNKLSQLNDIFGKNGIIATIINNSIQEIETEANEILNDIDGGQSTIEIETTKETKGKQLRDTLEIYIDTPMGRRKFDSFSGGEKTILNFSIRMALSKLLSTREKVWHGVIFLDEVFAALDKHNRSKMIIVINYLEKLFNQIFVISHTELQDSFPYLIKIEKDEKTGISIIKEAA